MSRISLLFFGQNYLIFQNPNLFSRYYFYCSALEFGQVLCILLTEPLTEYPYLNKGVGKPEADGSYGDLLHAQGQKLRSTEEHLFFSETKMLKPFTFYFFFSPSSPPIFKETSHHSFSKSFFHSFFLVSYLLFSLPKVLISLTKIYQLLIHYI